MAIKPILVLVLDGFGISSEVKGNAIKLAKTPVLDSIFEKAAYTTLKASGLEVGLPKGQMGNSEVGHMNIGAGRRVLQDLTYIDACIEDGKFKTNKFLLGALEHVIEKNSALHIMGLLSNGKVHSSIDHLYEILKLASYHNLKNVFLHVWTDGRDTGIHLGKSYICALEKFIAKLGIGEIKTVCGRFYSMDRDKHWVRVKLAYDAIARGLGREFKEAEKLVEEDYGLGISDEFIVPAVKRGYTGVKENDAIICFNFRPDRARQITQMFLENNNRSKIKIGKYICFCKYDSCFDCEVAFSPRKIKNTIGEYLSTKGFTQLRVAETEKFAHITFFLNAGAQEAFENENRVIIDSPKVKTYDLAPEMSSEKITDAIIEGLESKKYNIIFANFASPDMVGHTGNLSATIKAVEKIDGCIERIIKCAASEEAITIITADHGNAEKMLDSSGEIVTSHTCSEVPFAIYGYDCKLRKSGSLCDISPTILEILGLEKPAEMTGKSLII